MPPAPEPRRAVPIVAPFLGDDVAPVDDLVLHDHERVEDVEARGAQLADDAVVGLELRRARLVQPSWTGATFTRLELQDVVIEDGDLAGVTFDEGSFVRVAFVRCRMAGLVAPALKGTDVTFHGCRLDDAWLRAVTFERVELDDCSLPRADLYSARLKDVRLTRCDLREAELSQAQLDEVAFHGSRIEGLQGGSALRNAVIGSDQMIEFAVPVLHAAAVRVDDDYFG